MNTMTTARNRARVEGGLEPRDPRHHRADPRSSRERFLQTLPVLTLALLLGVGPAGCSGLLRPAPSSERYFVLAPLPRLEQATPASGSPSLGIRQVRLADYLFDSSLAVRRGANEVDYLPMVLWAERLDSGIQRVLASNLGTLLSTGHVRLSTWRSDDVTGEIDVTIDQFDVDTEGNGVLVARWRLAAPGGLRTIQARECRLNRPGPAPEGDPAGAVATLSALAGDLSREIARHVRDLAADAGRE